MKARKGWPLSPRGDRRMDKRVDGENKEQDGLSCFYDSYVAPPLFSLLLALSLPCYPFLPTGCGNRHRRRFSHPSRGKREDWNLVFESAVTNDNEKFKSPLRCLPRACLRVSLTQAGQPSELPQQPAPPSRTHHRRQQKSRCTCCFQRRLRALGPLPPQTARTAPRRTFSQRGAGSGRPCEPPRGLAGCFTRAEHVRRRARRAAALRATSPRCCCCGRPCRCERAAGLGSVVELLGVAFGLGRPVVDLAGGPYSSAPGVEAISRYEDPWRNE